MKDSILTTRNLKLKHLTYPDMEIKKGELVFFQGPSGSGKSTLFRLFTDLISPSQGQVYYKGRPLEELDPVNHRRKVLLVTQKVHLFDGTVGDNIKAFYDYREESPPKDSEMEEYLKLTQFPFGLNKVADHLSGGEAQRLFLALGLSMKPEVLLLDEPTSALDETTAKALFDRLIAYAKDRDLTLLVISHDNSLVDAYASRTIEIGGKA